MGYYMGDYYAMTGRSSFYRGDPFWGFLGRMAGTALKAITGLGGSGAKAEAPSVAQTIGKQAGMVVGRVKGIVSRHPVLSAAGAAAVLGASAGAGVESVGRGRMVVGPGGMVRRRHRRMRVTNPKALRRALRRAYGFERIAMKTIHLLHPKKKARFGGFKKRRRAA